MLVNNLAGLPRKYAKMGFKRGWAAYKRSKRSRTPTRRRSYNVRTRPMARRRRSYTRSRKVYRRARTGGGSFKPIIDGIIVGAAGSFLRGRIPYSDALIPLGVGYFRNNTTLKTIGAMNLGQQLLGTVGVGGSNGSNGGYL